MPLRGILISGLAGLALTGCAINPVTEQANFVLMSEAEEIELGRSYHQQFLQQNYIYEDEELAAYVNAVGQNIATLSHRSNLDYHVTIVDSPDLNAYALPGGFIYVTRGILAHLNSEAELAAVLGHEIGHVAARHAVLKDATQKSADFLGKTLFNHIGFGIDRSYNRFVDARLQSYSQAFELEADRLAQEYLVRSGYAPGAMSSVISTIKHQADLLARKSSTPTPKTALYHGFYSHPDTLQRLALVQANLQQLAEEFPQGRNPRHDIYLGRLQGLVYGDAAHGLVLDGHYLDASTRTGFVVPEGWHVNGQGKILQLVAPGEGAVIQVLSKPRFPGNSARDHLHQLLLSDELADEQALHSGDLDGWIASSTKQTREGEIPIWLATWMENERVLIMIGSATAAEKYEDAIKACLRSVYRPGADQLRLAAPMTIELIRVDQDTTYRDLAASSPLGSNAETRLRLLNGQMDSDVEPEPGRWIKIVRQGNRSANGSSRNGIQ